MTAKEAINLKTLYESNADIKRQFDLEFPEVVNFLKAFDTEFDFEMQLLPEEISILQQQMATSERQGDRKKCIKIGEEIISRLPQNEFPIFSSLVYLKIGTTLIVNSNSNTQNLKNAIINLKKAVAGLPEKGFDQPLIIGCYNIAIGHSNPILFDWENSDENWAEVILYGKRALDLSLSSNVNSSIDLYLLLEKIAEAYSTIGIGNREDNYDHAIFYWNKLLDILSSNNIKEYPFATIYRGLAMIYRTRQRGSIQENEKLQNFYLNKFNEYS